MSSFINPSSSRQSDDTDDKDDTKRKTRNLSEKKRRDQFNVLINELSLMLSTNSRKMDKSTVLKSTISFLKNHNDSTIRSRANEIQEDWKPSSLSNEEFTHLFLEALDGFIIVFSSSGRLLYVSESITSLLGHFTNDLLTMTMYDLVFEGDHTQLYNIILGPTADYDEEKEVSLSCHCRRGGQDPLEQPVYELVRFLGQFRSDVDTLSMDTSISQQYSFATESDTRWVFVGSGRLETPQLIRELSIIDSTKCEFTSRHSLEWKFLFLDHRAPPIIGYLPFEVLGTSGYDYYHVDDLDNVVVCHEALMEKGEGTSCYYRFLTKGQQWIWLQTRFYITYHQWNSKPEFIVCTHRVVSYLNVMKEGSGSFDSLPEITGDKTKSYSSNSQWPSRTSVITASKRDRPDSNSMSADSPLSRNSQHAAVDLLERRQEELQQKILQQQTQLRQVTEQLFMAKYGIFSPAINVALPCQATPELYLSESAPLPSLLDPQQLQLVNQTDTFAISQHQADVLFNPSVESTDPNLSPNP